MDSASTSFILGYHGCDRAVAESVLSGRQSLHPSENDYDWLGDGIYFWEHNAQRAYEFACELRAHPRNKRQIKHPTVVGAIIDLALCLNMLDSRYIAMVRRAHQEMVAQAQATGAELPENSVGSDLLLRKLDCAVIRFLHKAREAAGNAPFDTVRAAFFEGQRLYTNAGFAAKNHIQICVRN
ncbi:MAG TPA: hypothetical protein VG722_01675, partial [Tepidisphaeraceae bacterium]|nr:hypothetical protein [Tepidisphaeraceae bacterium]